ncbi:substrate-binding periplasmic protein [Spartinivicinus poritis]|uniref:Transporter substrate-binding domain-containing protein n=1 Tax=Spartinivicinus poritis TaxID=2994640 RepID=A0ABT5UD24_9GAMM|nr:transporter substrate-binding domain-containing protein [Spartinivicinus sp. A2-2]MDE1463348.1 transporter substrate-binding domain-containing protein [Spartinivicinus sp. A2-2]
MAKITIIFLCTILACQSALTEELPLLFANFPPVNYVDEQGKMKGISYEIITGVVTEMGYQPNVRTLPWKRAYHTAAQGKAAILFTFTQNEQRKKEFYFTDMILPIADVFFKKKSKQIQWETLADLANYRIGYTDGYNYHSSFLRAIANKEFIARKSPALEHPELQHLKNLFNDRVDLIICEVNVCLFHLRNNPRWQAVIDYIPKAIGPIRSFHAGISKAWPNSEALLKQFKAAYQKFKKAGKRKAILTKYKAAELTNLIKQ